MLTYAFIPARSGSKGVPDKNSAPIDGHPLLAYAIAFGKALGIDQVICSTDSPFYAQIAESYGALVPGLRGAEASSDTAMEEQIVEELTRELPKRGIPVPDLWLRLKPTNPFRSVASVRQAIDLLTTDPNVESVRIVSKADPRLVVKNVDGFLEPLLTDIWDPNRSVMRRTEFVEAYSPFNLDVFRHENWKKYGSGYMGKRIFPIVEHAITGLDINDPDDLDLVRAIIESRPRPAFLNDYIIAPA